MFPSSAIAYFEVLIALRAVELNHLIPSKDHGCQNDTAADESS
jgi:hypothetical protein